MFSSIDAFRKVGKLSQKVLGGLVRAGVREAIHSTPVVGSVVRLVEELADNGVVRLLKSEIAIPDVKAIGEIFSDDQLLAINDWLGSLQNSLGDLEGKLTAMLEKQASLPWDRIAELVEQILLDRPDLAEEFGKVKDQLEEQTLSLHRIEETQSDVYHVVRGIEESQREIKQILVELPSIVEYAAIKRTNPDLFPLLLEMDRLFMAGEIEKWLELSSQILGKRGKRREVMEVLARKVSLQARLQGRGKAAVTVLERAGVPADVVNEVTRYAANSTKPTGSSWPCLPRGFEIESKYKVVEEVGRGGMASVYKVVGIDEWLNKGKEFALKVPSPRFFQEQDFARRFITEIGFSLKLSKAAELQQEMTGERPAIVHTYAHVIFTDPPTKKKLYGLVMDLIPGTTLASWLEQRQKQGKKVSAKAIEKILEPICKALEFAHSQKPPILHRDGTPRNILLGKDAATGEMKVWLSDFGIGRALEENRDAHTQTGAVVGSMPYLPAELFDSKNRNKVGPHTDVFILGRVLKELMTFSPYGVVEPEMGYPEHWEDVVDKATREVPSKRYQTVNLSLVPSGNHDCTNIWEGRFPGLMGSPKEPVVLPITSICL